MREAVGILNSPVIISEAMHVVVVWQHQSEVTQFHISAKESHLLALVSALAFLLQQLEDEVEDLWGGPSLTSAYAVGFLFYLKCNLKQNSWAFHVGKDKAYSLLECASWRRL